MSTEEPREKMVYVVTCGTYSDYQIVAIYSAREDAVNRVNGENARPFREEARLEEWPLNAHPKFGGRVWQSMWWATEASLRDSRPAHAYEAWYEGDDPGNAKAIEGEDFPHEEAAQKCRYIMVVGHSKEHVQKSANDRRQRVRAELLGL